MPVHPTENYWVPLLSPKQTIVFNDFHKYILLSGCRRSSKTVACLHRLLRHAWETPMARIAIFARTRKSAEQGGVFTDLMDTVVPEWVSAGFGFRVCSGNKDASTSLIDGATRILYLDVSNVHGNKSRIQLHSLDFDFDIEAAIRGTRFSMIYFSELSNFENRIVYVISAEQLRMPHLREDQHMWLADTNPAPDGSASWIYKLFYEERLAENHPYPTEQKKFSVHEFGLQDNPFISEEEKQGVAARHAHDPDLMSRFVHGLWTTRTEDSVFAGVFLPDTHVLGNIKAFNEEDWELLLPTDTCSSFVTGWDLGSKNHAMVLIEKIPGPDGSIFCVLDEVVTLDQTLPIPDFTDFVLERVDFWEAYIRLNCHTKPLEWKHWSDQSAFDQYRAALGGYDHSSVALASEGRIMLLAAPKGKGSITKRIDIARRLLFQNRLFVSAKCIEVIKMLGGLRPGKTRLDPVARGPLVHTFDALTYALSAECYFELGEFWAPKIAPPSTLVAVRY